MTGWSICKRWDRSTPFTKSDFWYIYRGFYDQHHEDYGTTLDQGVGL